MSKSLSRVRQALTIHAPGTEIVEEGQARTAAEAAARLGCAVGQIANSIMLLGAESGQAKLFLTSGANRVDLGRAGALAGEALVKADAAVIRAQTGFAIGGVAPLGHLSEVAGWMDQSLFSYAQIYAAAGTPRHLFGIAPIRLAEICDLQVSDFITL